MVQAEAAFALQRGNFSRHPRTTDGTREQFCLIVSFFTMVIGDVTFISVRVDGTHSRAIFHSKIKYYNRFKNKISSPPKLCHKYLTKNYKMQANHKLHVTISKCLH